MHFISEAQYLKPLGREEEELMPKGKKSEWKMPAFSQSPKSSFPYKMDETYDVGIKQATQA